MFHNELRLYEVQMNHQKQWQRFQKYHQSYEELEVSLDISRMNFSESFFEEMKEKIEHSFMSMEKLEKGAIANPDENRMVGHYWLRESGLAPNAEIKKQIDESIQQISEFTQGIRSGELRTEKGLIFEHVILIGIGGSCLGPQFIDQALVKLPNRIQLHFLDNTDADGIDQVLAVIGDGLAKTMTIVVSKSGSTRETTNGMLEMQWAYQKANLNFSKHAVAITSAGSKLDQLAKSEGWLQIFPMWDWVGGRTSVFSAVGLVPASLRGVDIQMFMQGGRKMDRLTRNNDALTNPAALLALMWYSSGEGKGTHDMVILPYKDRLSLFSKYLQQLIMESLGKELDVEGNVVHQGMVVLGNKGSTDQHSYVQQLVAGKSDFFVTFISVLKDREEKSKPIEAHTTTGDYLHAFQLGTREALSANGRQSITIEVQEITPQTVGALIALYERTVGIYATLIHINAYHQPAVEAGKKAAGVAIALQQQMIQFLSNHQHQKYTLHQIVSSIQQEDLIENAFLILNRLAHSPHSEVRKEANGFDAKYWIEA